MDRTAHCENDAVTLDFDPERMVRGNQTEGDTDGAKFGTLAERSDP